MQTSLNAVARILVSKNVGSRTGLYQSRFMDPAQTTQACIDFLPTFMSVEQANNITNCTAIVRLMQAVRFAVTRDYANEWCPGTAHVFATLALSTQDRIAFGDLKSVMGATQEGRAPINGVSRQKLIKFLGRVGTMGTISSKLSRSVGKGGFLTELALTYKAGGNDFVIEPFARTSTLTVAYAYALQAMTNDVFTLITGEQA